MAGISAACNVSWRSAAHQEHQIHYSFLPFTLFYFSVSLRVAAVVMSGTRLALIQDCTKEILDEICIQ